MKLSVAIATYNRAAMVKEAITAALAQSRAPEEIVVSDDASPDATVETIRAMNEKRVTLLTQSENSGGVENWNRAIEATSGDLIAWCSDDDRFLHGHLEVAEAFLEAHPEVGLVHSGFVDAIETAEGSQVARRLLRPEKILTRRGLVPYLIRYYDWPFHPSTIVMRRGVWEQAGPFNPRYKFADTDWFIRAVEKFPAAYLARHSVMNRRHPGNWSNQLGSAHLQREVFGMVEKAIDRNYSMATRWFWKALWRANVRARLALTMRARIRSGHEEAALAAWRGIVENTGRQIPKWFTRWGGKIIARMCAGRETKFRDARESVSPL
jgi:glycosyltransferase involved in cell wall biosynthesis